MATFALLNAFTYVDSHDFTADSNKLDFKAEGAPVETSTFRSTWKSHVMGLKNFDFTLSGLWQAGSDTVDPESYDNMGTGQVTTFGAEETEGQPCVMLQQMPLSYQLLGSIGDATPFTLSGKNSGVAGGVIRGYLAKEMGTVSATGALGTAVEAGAVGASQYLYGTFHVFGTPGTTITAVLESDDNADFSSATTRITFGPYTTAGGRWATRVAGAIADDYWRFRVTAITGTFTVAAAFGIQ